MQPYFFPYLGYYQLVNAVDAFVFYDDVNFINKGWINRNNLVLNGKKTLFTLPLKNASQNLLINEIEVAYDSVWINKFYKTLEYNYKKSLYYNDVMDLISVVFKAEKTKIAEIAQMSIISTFSYLGIMKQFHKSSEFVLGADIKGENRIIQICKKLEAKNYVNPSGGEELYNYENFQEEGLSLAFIQPQLLPYKQLGIDEFIPGMSMLDILFNTGKNEIKEMLNHYTLKTEWQKS
jgi:hypothetical protein